MTKPILKTAIKRRRKVKEALAVANSLTEQFRMAGLVQRDFLPSTLPNSDKLQWATTFLPAEWVSGDLYDITRLDEEHIGFYVADVVGHGIAAALLTMFLKQTLVMRETIGNSYRIFSPAEVLRNLNLKLTAQKLSDNQFITCCYCLLNTANMKVTYSRAGHPYPILMRGAEEPRQLESQGSLLGIFEENEYVEEEMQLCRGDKLLLYSDGMENIIGTFENQEGFKFTEEFREIKDLPILEMTEKLNILIENQDVDPAVVDDITTVGLEIL